MCRPCSLSPAASVAPASALVAALPLAPVPGLWPAFVLLSLSPHRNKTNKKEGESRAAGERAGGADGRLLVSFSTRPDEQRAPSVHAAVICHGLPGTLGSKKANRIIRSASQPLRQDVKAARPSQHQNLGQLGPLRYVQEAGIRRDDPLQRAALRVTRSCSTPSAGTLATMRPVRHPIAIFVVSVLAVIGIGVGVVAATTHQKVYGPSWGRFSAAFTGRVHLVRSGPVASAPHGDPMRYINTYYYANQHFNGWVGYGPLSGSIFPPDLRAVVVTEVARDEPGSRSVMRRLIADPQGGYLSAAGMRKTEEVADGLRVITFGPRCRYGECEAELVVSNSRVAWDVLAASNGPASTVAGFIASFQPIG